MTAGLPPHPFEPLSEVIPRGTIVYRTHEPVLPGGATNDGTLPNPGYGKPTRFGFFGHPTVPILYVADTPAAAAHESVFHDVEAGSFVPRIHWKTKVLTALEVRDDLEVVVFHSDGLRRFDLFPRDLTDTDRTHYHRTVRWAEAAWKTGAQGISYMCRHYNSSKALCLFADRLGNRSMRALPDHPDTRAFSVPVDAEWLAGLALAVGVTLRP